MHTQSIFCFVVSSNAQSIPQNFHTENDNATKKYKPHHKTFHKPLSPAQSASVVGNATLWDYV